jgi:hypothetical protein
MPSDIPAAAIPELVQAALPPQRGKQNVIPSFVAPVPYDPNAQLGSPANPVGPKAEHPSENVSRSPSVPRCYNCHLNGHVKLDALGNIHCSWPMKRTGASGNVSGVGVGNAPSH